MIMRYAGHVVSMGDKMGEYRVSARTRKRHHWEDVDVGKIRLKWMSEK
jgi:hypothetical protein